MLHVRVDRTFTGSTDDELLNRLNALPKGHIITVTRTDRTKITGPLHPDPMVPFVGDVPVMSEYHNGGAQVWIRVEWDEKERPDWMDWDDRLRVYYAKDKDGALWHRKYGMEWERNDGKRVWSEELNKDYGPLLPLQPVHQVPKQGEVMRDDLCDEITTTIAQVVVAGKGTPTLIKYVEKES